MNQIRRRYPRLRRWGALILTLWALLLAVPAHAQQINQVFTESSSERMSADGVAADSTGNRYVIGNFRGTVIFGTGINARQLTTTGQEDTFIAKYDPAGNLLWVQQDSSSAPMRAKAIAVDDSGQLYVTGEFNHPFAFDGLRMNSFSFTDGYLMKLNPATGAAEWAARINSAQTTSVNSLAIDRSGAC
ncbi:MAG: hypothetical protein R2932_43210 [Caldilineaceae bacterium]